MSSVTPTAGDNSPTENGDGTPLFVSVCLAVGPCEPLSRVRETLESIRRQRGARVEVVVKTVGLHLDHELRQYASESGLRLALVTGEDSGIYDALNRCVAAAAGTYVVVLGCGDVLHDAAVVENLSTFANRHGNPTILYGSVLIRPADGGAMRSFDNRCFFNERPRLPWRNPCHSQGLLYRRDWLQSRPFSITVGPLADLVHTYQHRVFEVARWIDRPISVFSMGGVSNRRDLAAFKARLTGLYANCGHFRYAPLWRALSLAVCSASFALGRA